MFRLARRHVFVHSPQYSRGLSGTVTRLGEWKIEDIYPQDEDVPLRGQTVKPGPRKPWAERMQKEPLVAGTPSDNPHLEALYDLAKETEETQRVDQDVEPTTPKKVSEDWKRSASLRIYGVPNAMQESDLVEIFSKYGDISDSKVGVIGGLRMGMVSFTAPGIADKTVAAHEYSPIRFNGQELTVRYGSFTRLNQPAKTVFCTNFAPDTEEAIKNRLTFLFNPWARAQRMRFVPRGNMCFLDFKSVEDAQKVVDRHELRPFRDQGRILRINYAVEKEPLPPHHTLCITGYSGDAMELEDHFPQHEAGNHIVEISSVPDPRGERPPSYFVRFENIDYATAALRHAEENTAVPYKARYAAARSNSRPSTPRQKSSRR